MKRTLPVLMLLVSVLFVAGCGKNGDRTRSTSDASADIDPVTGQKYGFFGRHPRPVEFLVVFFVGCGGAFGGYGVVTRATDLGGEVFIEVIPIGAMTMTPLMVLCWMVVYYVFISPSDPAVLSPVTSVIDDIIRAVF